MAGGGWAFTITRVRQARSARIQSHSSILKHGPFFLQSRLFNKHLPVNYRFVPQTWWPGRKVSRSPATDLCRIRKVCVRTSTAESQCKLVIAAIRSL